ncbi:hypothetical protein Scep_023504 [Stephania cephalantha]|uniref:Uncharacterized protein n=1 Tax=Stephania cephalantha TaxID=152367 RepID=A0AAP0F3S0_9MAGN
MEAHVPFFPIRAISIHHHHHRPPPPPSSLPSPRRWLVAFTTPLSLQSDECFTGEATTDASDVNTDYIATFLLLFHLLSYLPFGSTTVELMQAALGSDVERRKKILNNTKTRDLAFDVVFECSNGNENGI